MWPAVKQYICICSKSTWRPMRYAKQQEHIWKRSVLHNEVTAFCSCCNFNPGMHRSFLLSPSLTLKHGSTLTALHNSASYSSAQQFKTSDSGMNQHFQHVSTISPNDNPQNTWVVDPVNELCVVVLPPPPPWWRLLCSTQKPWCHAEPKLDYADPWAKSWQLAGALLWNQCSCKHRHTMPPDYQ